MTIKNIFKLLKFHPFFYFVVMAAVVTGNFNNFILFMSIIIFHELGHISVGLLFKWKLEKIIILPFGGLTIFDEYINRPILEEFLVCIAGPIFQIIYYFLVSNFFDIKNIHYSLLFFNLLPLVPLDGSKLLNLCLNKLLPFYSSHILTSVVSILIAFLGLLILVKWKWNLLLFLTLLLLIFKTIKEIKNTNYIFNRFLLERYIRNLNIIKIKKIRGSNLKRIYRDYKHVFIYDKNYYTEREIIRKRFDLQVKVW